jgi:chromatin assembly factor 1 subunit B
MTSKKETSRRVQLTNQKKAQGSFLGELCSTSLRRAAWSPDGSLFAAPCGKAKDVPEDMRNCFYIFARQQLEAPIVRFCVKGTSEVLGCVWAPCFFEPLDRSHLEGSGNADESAMKPWGPAEYRMALAIWTADSVIVYTTDSGSRHSDFTDLHFSSITSVAWSHDARFLLTSSMDGYVSVVMFHQPIGVPHATPQGSAAGAASYCQSLSTLLLDLRAEAASVEFARTEAASRMGTSLHGDSGKSSAGASVAVVKKKKRLEAPPPTTAHHPLTALPPCAAAEVALPEIDASELATLLS